jgi:sortase (surface protein transpeptidase)
MTRLRLEVKLRSFSTSPGRRSKKIKQAVFKIGHFGIQECAVSFTHKKQNRTKKDKKQLFPPKVSTVVMTFGVLGIVFFSLQLFGYGHSNPPVVTAQSILPAVIESKPGAASQLEAQSFLPSSTPTTVTIPSISVNAEIHDVGLLPSGAIETPELFSDMVGWYKYGPTPGEVGPAVLVGHVDTYKGPSVFWNLSNLVTGDIIDVQRADGTEAQFSVDRITQYNQDNFQTDEVYGNIDYAGLRVITCGGTFNHFTGRYSHNTVIFASLVQ